MNGFQGLRGLRSLPVVAATAVAVVLIAACGGSTSTTAATTTNAVDANLFLTAAPESLKIPGLGRAVGPSQTVVAYDGKVFMTFDNRAAKYVALAYACGRAPKGLRPRQKPYTVSIKITASVTGVHFSKTVSCTTRLGGYQPRGVVHFGPIPKEREKYSFGAMLDVRGPASGAMTLYYPAKRGR